MPPVTSRSGADMGAAARDCIAAISAAMKTVLNIFSPPAFLIAQIRRHNRIHRLKKAGSIAFAIMRISAGGDDRRHVGRFSFVYFSSRSIIS
jgi:hypothetical protein